MIAKVIRRALRPALLVGCLISPKPASTQTIQASLSGTITDLNGDGIPGANVTATQESIAFLGKTQSAANGVYRIAGLPIGYYDVSVAKPGFNAVNLTRIRLYVGQERNLDFK